MIRGRRIIRIYVRNKNRYNPATKERSFLYVDIVNYAGTTIGNIKEDVRRQCKNAVKLDELFLNNQPLADDRSVAHYNLGDGTILESTSNPFLVSCLYIKAAEVVQAQEGNPLDEAVQAWTKKSLPKKWTLIKVLLNSDSNDGQPPHFPTLNDFVVYLERLGRKGATMHPNYTQKDIREMEDHYNREFLGKYTDSIAQFIDYHAIRLGYLHPDEVEGPMPPQQPHLPGVVPASHLPGGHFNQIVPGRGFPVARVSNAIGVRGKQIVPRNSVGERSQLAVPMATQCNAGRARAAVHGNQGQGQRAEVAGRGKRRGKKQDHPCEDCEAVLAEVYCGSCTNATGGLGVCLCCPCSDALHAGATRRAHNIADITEAPKNDKEYCPRAFLAPFAVLLALYSGLTDRTPLLSMTEDEIKGRAQQLTDTDLYQKQTGKFVGGFDCMENTLMTKGLVQKEAAVEPTYALTETGQRLGDILFSFYTAVTNFLTTAGVPTLNHRPKQPVFANRKLCLLIDENERDKARLLQYSAENGINAQTRYLPSGDYIWILTPPMVDPSMPYTGSDTTAEEVLPFIVERKSWDDFENTVSSARFQRQVNNMLGSGLKNCFYLMEGSVSSLRSNPSQQQQKKLKTLVENLLLETGFYVNFTHSWMKSAQWLIWLTNMIIHGLRLGLYRENIITYQEYASRVARQHGTAVPCNAFKMAARVGQKWTGQQFIDLLFRHGTSEDRMLNCVQDIAGTAGEARMLILIQDLEAYNRKRQSMLNKCLFAVRVSPGRVQDLVQEMLTPDVDNLVHYNTASYWQLFMQVLGGVYVMRTESQEDTDRIYSKFVSKAQGQETRELTTGVLDVPTRKERLPRKKGKTAKGKNYVDTVTTKGENPVERPASVAAFTGTGYMLGTSHTEQQQIKEAAEGDAGNQTFGADDFIDSQNEEEIVQQLIVQSAMEAALDADAVDAVIPGEIKTPGIGIPAPSKTSVAPIPGSVEEEDRQIQLALRRSRLENSPANHRKRVHKHAQYENESIVVGGKKSRAEDEDEQLKLGLALSMKDAKSCQSLRGPPEDNEDAMMRLAIERSKIENYSPVKTVLHGIKRLVADSSNSNSNQTEILSLAAKIGGQGREEVTPADWKFRNIENSSQTTWDNQCSRSEAAEVITLIDSQDTDCQDSQDVLEVDVDDIVESCDREKDMEQVIEIDSQNSQPSDLVDVSVESPCLCSDQTEEARSVDVEKKNSRCCCTIIVDKKMMSSDSAGGSEKRSAVGQPGNTSSTNNVDGHRRERNVITDSKLQNKETIYENLNVERTEMQNKDEEKELVPSSPQKNTRLSLKISVNGSSQSQMGSQAIVSSSGLPLDIVSESQVQNQTNSRIHSLDGSRSREKVDDKMFSLKACLFPSDTDSDDDDDDGKDSDYDIFADDVPPVKINRKHSDTFERKMEENFTKEKSSFEKTSCQIGKQQNSAAFSEVALNRKETVLNSDSVQEQGLMNGETTVNDGTPDEIDFQTDSKTFEGHISNDQENMTASVDDHFNMDLLSVNESFENDLPVILSGKMRSVGSKQPCSDGNENLNRLSKSRRNEKTHEESNIVLSEEFLAVKQEDMIDMKPETLELNEIANVKTEQHLSKTIGGLAETYKSGPLASHVHENKHQQNDAEIAKALQDLFDREMSHQFQSSEKNRNSNPAVLSDEFAPHVRMVMDSGTQPGGSVDMIHKEDGIIDNIGSSMDEQNPSAVLSDAEYARLLDAQLNEETVAGTANKAIENTFNMNLCFTGDPSATVDDEKYARELQEELNKEQAGKPHNTDTEAVCTDETIKTPTYRKLSREDRGQRQKSAAQLEEYRRLQMERYQTDKSARRLTAPRSTASTPTSRHHKTDTGLSNFRENEQQDTSPFSSSHPVNRRTRASSTMTSVELDDRDYKSTGGGTQDSVRTVGRLEVGGETPYRIDLTARQPERVATENTATDSKDSKVIVLDDSQEDEDSLANHMIHGHMTGISQSISIEDSQSFRSNVTCGNCGMKGHTRISKDCPKFYTAEESARREERQERIRQRQEEKAREAVDTINLLDEQRRNIETIENQLQQQVSVLQADLRRRATQLESEVKNRVKKLETAAKRKRKK